MSSATQTKDDRINLRLKHSAKLTLERAASFEGQTISKFVLSSALARAEKTIQKQEIISLNRKDSEAFFNALAVPVRFNSKLLATFEEHDRRVTGK
ncbi:MAG: hypothetical protein BMS9Abin06_1093 [Gammaproteobacteria bacterium]|nr:MAG: hypothetical protein BMS9Abin06_1093 [Gammaproteobacteria bacterium]